MIDDRICSSKVRQQNVAHVTWARAVISTSKMLSVTCLDEMHLRAGCMYLMEYLCKPKYIAVVIILHSQLRKVKGRDASGDLTMTHCGSVKILYIFVEFGEIVWARIPTTKKLGKLDHRWVEVVWPESSRWRREVILEVAGCPWDMRPIGRTSPPDALSRVAVFGNHAPAGTGGWSSFS